MRVLIVDDFEPNRSILARWVAQCGHEPVTAANGFAALELAAKFPPDLVLMDISMPGIDGYETTKRLRSDPKQTAPVYAVSAFDRNPKLLEEAGMKGHYQKPLEFDCLRELLNC